MVTACSGKEEKNAPERRGALLKLLEREGSHPEREILEMVLNHYHIFSLDERERGCVTGMEHVIDTDDYPPIQQLLHRVPFALRRKYLRWCSRWWRKVLLRSLRAHGLVQLLL